MSAGNLHVLPVLCNRATSDLDALRLEDAGNLLVGQWPGWIFFLDQLLHPALQDEERRVGALRPVYAFTEEVAQLEDTLGGVGIFAGHRAADGGRMYANLFRHFFDHHRPQLVDTVFQKIVLPFNDAVADFQDRLLALFNVLDQLYGGFIPLFYVIANIFFSGFFLDLRLMWQPIKVLAWSLPATYGIRMLQDIMLRGTSIPPLIFEGLALIGIGLFLVNWLLLKRRMEAY